MADVQGVSGERLKQYLDRIERLTEEKQGFQDDIVAFTQKQNQQALTLKS